MKLPSAVRRVGAILGISRTRIRSERELKGYIARLGAACIAVALCFDIANQLLFFETWGVAFRSWGITVAVAATISLPLLAAIGRAQLDLYRSSAEFEKLSRTDPLTGLMNRRALFDENGAEAAVLALVIVDIDRFKGVNDSYGHLAGDEVIRTVAHMLSTTLGDLGRVGRLGGEEFAVLSHEAAQATLVERVEEFRERVAQTPIFCGGARVYVTISAGIASRSRSQTLDQLYVIADQALYAAKWSGRNRVMAASDLPGGAEALGDAAGSVVRVAARRSRGDPNI